MTFQGQCNRLTQAVLMRRLIQTDPKPQLYFCKVRERAKDETEAWILMSDDFPIQRMVICGGNAGFCDSDTFGGVARGCRLPFRCESFISVKPIDISSMEIFS